MNFDNTRDLLERTGFQQIVKEYLIKENGFIEGFNSTYDLHNAIDRKFLFKYLEESQPKEFEKLKSIKNYEDKFVTYLREEIHDRGLLDVLRNPVKFYGAHFDMVTYKPQTNFNKDDVKAYKANKFSITEELVYKLKDDGTDGGRGDLTIFINGIPIIWIELKCNSSGQSLAHVKDQYRKRRSPDDLVFKFKEGCLVCFGIELDNVCFTTKLQGMETYFMPFDKGNNKHAGNPEPANKNDVRTSYMWRDILTKDNILEWLEQYFVLETIYKKDIHGNRKKHETIIFPRYHQLYEVNKIIKDVKKQGVNGQNYLIMDSPGSGKTYSISWLAHHLCTLHDDNNKVIYDSVIVITDRKVVDNQLQDAVLRINHKEGVVAVMDDDCSSKDLADAINHNTRIIVSTIQKFSYILPIVSPMRDHKFAVVIDECHSSTKGAYIQKANKALSMSAVEEEEENESNITAQDDVIKQIEDDRLSSGRQKNITFFGFSATPTQKTLEKFGTPCVHKGEPGHKPFVSYSMQQAIDEGFILDVLKNYVTYETYFKTNKLVKDNPKLKSSKTKKAIYRSAMLHPTNIKQKIAIIMEHFLSKVRDCLSDRIAKAMVVTDSREAAVRYKMEFDAYIISHNIPDIKALVAFTGEVKLKETGDKKYSESSLNKFPESETKDRFNTTEYQVLLVADKYQTGYDQPLLCAMYVDKKLNGINAVQTLGRLNRSYPGKEEVFILDFRNDYDDIKDAFQDYYEDIILFGETDPNKIYKLERFIDDYHLVTEEEILEFIKLTLIQKKSNEQKSRWYALLGNAKAKYDLIEEEKEQDELRKAIKKFVEQYSWIIQVTDWEDKNLHQKHYFYKHLAKYLSAILPPKVDVSSLVSFLGFKQKQTKVVENVKNPVKGKLVVKKVGGSNVSISTTIDELEPLEQIIKSINSLFATDIDVDAGSTALLYLIKVLTDDNEVKLRAKKNKIEDFKLFLKEKLDKILIKNRKSADKFYQNALDNEAIADLILEYIITVVYPEAKK